MRTLVDRDTVQELVKAVAATELIPLTLEPQNGRMYNYGGTLPGSADPAILELSPGAQWLNDVSLAAAEAAPSVLYVRPAYQVLLLLAMAFVDHSEVPHHRVVITGSSGTGKTSFLNWVLRHLRRQEKPPVIVLDISGFFGRIASDGEVTAGTRGSSFRQELAARSTVYLCDATWTDDADFIHPEIQARTIVMSPPMLTVTMKDPSDTMRTLVLVMPLWTIAELETCRSTCYSHSVSEETLVELYQLWGGAVQWTLGTPRTESKREFVRSLEFLSFASVVEIVRNGGLVGRGAHQLENDFDTAIKTGSRLIHMHVDPDGTFQRSGAAICSTSACSLLISSNSNHLKSAHDFVGRINCFAEPWISQFYEQVQQDLFDRTSTTP